MSMQPPTASIAPESTRLPRVLIADDEPILRNLCAELAAESGFDALAAATTEEALNMLEMSPVDLLITDLCIPELGGMNLLRTVRAKYPRTEVVVLTQYGGVETAVEAMRIGALDYITKPFRNEEFQSNLPLWIGRGPAERGHRRRSRQPSSEPSSRLLVGESPAIREIRDLVSRIASRTHPVLITGETGAGKEVVARLIHASGPRRNAPFVVVDCSALTPTLIESELFGHTKGAFTGAWSERKGLLAAADTGTGFLDEIGELPLELQGKLLRVLQEREIRPLGAVRPMSLDIRIVAATHRDLEKAVADGTFRQDLFYRLNVVQIVVPPLRQRKEDIPLLVAALLERRSWRSVSCVHPDALSRLIMHDWPGNVRELENVLERAIALGTGEVLLEKDFGMEPSDPLEYEGSQPSVRPMWVVEKHAILAAVREHRRDIKAAAKALGIGKTTLYKKLKDYAQPKQPANPASAHPGNS